MSKLYNRVGEQTATAGIGTITFSGDIDESFATFVEAGVVDGDVVTYLLKSGGAADDFEIGRGTIGGSVTTMTRDTVLLSKIGGTAGTTKLNLSGTSEVRIVIAAEDVLNPIRHTALTNTVAYVPNLKHETSATPAAGIGIGLQFEVETAAGNDEIGAVIEAVTTDVGAGVEDFALDFKLMNNGAAAVIRARIDGDGNVTLRNDTTITGHISATIATCSHAAHGGL
jgi:hypothetical protein